MKRKSKDIEAISLGGGGRRSIIKKKEAKKKKNNREREKVEELQLVLTEIPNPLPWPRPLILQLPSSKFCVNMILA